MRGLGVNVTGKRNVDGIPFEIAVKRFPLKDFDTFYNDQLKRLPALVRKVARGLAYDGSIGVEDIVQDALAAAAVDWERIGRMADPGKYVRTVAANRTERVVERVRREAVLLVDDFETLIGTLVAVEAVAMADLVRDVLRMLPRRRAQVIYLTVDGWSDTQIGEQLGIAPATVRAHRHQVRRVFTDRMRQAGWDLEEALGVAA